MPALAEWFLAVAQRGFQNVYDLSYGLCRK